MTEHAAPTRLKVVYILGSSRSGSTILDGVLGTSGSALSTGELGHIDWAFSAARDPSDGSTQGYCSCGLLVTDCPVWSRVWSELSAHYDTDDLQREGERFETVMMSAPALVWGRLFRTRRFRAHLDALADSVRIAARVANRGTVIDSSKGPERGWLYSLLPPAEFDVRFVHIVRDGRSVVSSMMTHYDPHKFDSGPSPWPPLAAAAFATAHWVYMNFVSTLLGTRNRRRYLCVRYEDLVRDPIPTLSSLETFLGIDLEEPRRRVVAGEPLSTGHVLCGNRSKVSPVLRVQSRKSPGETGLRRGPSLVFLSLAGWLQWLYRRAPPASGGGHAPA